MRIHRISLIISLGLFLGFFLVVGQTQAGEWANMATYDKMVEGHICDVSISPGGFTDVDCPETNPEILADGTISATGISVTGAISTTSLFVNGTEVTGGGGGTSDDLGNHTASQTLNLNGNWLSGDGDAEGLLLDDNGNVTVSGDASMDGDVNVMGNISATSYIGDGSNLTGLGPKVVAYGFVDDGSSSFSVHHSSGFTLSRLSTGQYRAVFDTPMTQSYIVFGMIHGNLNRIIYTDEIYSDRFFYRFFYNINQASKSTLRDHAHFLIVYASGGPAYPAF